MTLREEIERKIEKLQGRSSGQSPYIVSEEVYILADKICQLVKERLENIQYAPGKKVNDFEECSFHYCNGLEKLITELEEKSEE